jgi:hypothetical protein
MGRRRKGYGTATIQVLLRRKRYEFCRILRRPLSRQLCEVRTISIGHTKVELYEIEPGARTRWIVVRQVDGYKNTVKVFQRQNKRFLENSMDQLSRETKKQIMQRFPTLAMETKALLAGVSARGSVEWFRKSVKKLG